VPWANRACSFDKVDCWGLCVLYYRHVLGIELHQTPDYEAGEDFFTCYQGDVVFWRQVDKPVEGGIFVGYRGAQPAHVGLVLNRRRCTRAARTEACAWTRCWSFSGHSPKWSISYGAG
jgi:cell wall-associated NlpC family hydrolase